MAIKWLTFTAPLKKVDINPCVAVPKNITEALAIRGYVPVELNLDGSRHLANLVPLGNGQHRLYINGVMLKSTGWQVGDTVTIKLRHDPTPRIEPMSPALAAQLTQSPKAKAIFDNLPPSRQKEINRYLNNLKSTEAIERNVAKIIRALEGDGRHMLVRPKDPLS